MKKSIIFTTITILFLSTFASAQFKIKIPKIKTPKIPKVNKDIKETVNSNVTSAKGKNRQMVIDDGYTFFKAMPVKSERIAKYSGYIAKGWTLEGHFRVFGTFPDNSNMKMVVVKNGKALATYYCSTKLLHKTTTSDPFIKNSPMDDFMATNTGNKCGGSEKTFVKEPGKYDVQVYAINGDNDEETLLRTYKIDVREAIKTRPGKIPGVSDFYIQRHAEAPVAIMKVNPSKGSGGYLADNYFLINTGNTLRGNVDIYLNVATENDVMDFKENPYIRCFNNGERLKLYQNGYVLVKRMRGDSGVLRLDGKQPDRLSFFVHRINLPIPLKTNRATSVENRYPSFETHQGEWKCDLRAGAETIRTFRWTVGEDGLPIEHPEQTSGNINLHWGSTLVDVEFPEGGSSADKSLIPMPNAGLFYGIPWKSEEGKKMAAEVPTKGKPYLMQ